MNRILARARGVSVLASLVACGFMAGCTGLEGTIRISVVTAPDSDLRDRVERVRLTSSNPMMTVEVDRSPDGSFALSLDLKATGANADITFEGFAADGTLIAYGRTPPVPIQAIEADIAIYVAAPMSLAEAPVPMPSARRDMGVARLPSGVALAGGRLADGEVSGALDVYSAYNHDFQQIRDMPGARAGITAFAGAIGSIYLFGGVDESGRDSANFWRLNTTEFDPTGSYFDLGADEAWARSFASAAPIANEQFMLTGDPPLVIANLTGGIDDDPGAPALFGTATTIITDGAYHTLFIGAGNGDGGGFVLSGDNYTALDEPALRRMGHGTVVLPDATALTLGGQTADFFDTAGFSVDPRSGAVARHPGLLTVARVDAAIAATSEFVVVAGGRDAGGAIVPDAEILDATTLEPVATLPMVVPRHGATAVALNSGQVAIFGGLDSADSPVDTIELFTPEPTL